MAVVVLDGEELPISICLIQHRLAHQLGGSLLLQEGLVLDPLMLAPTHVTHEAVFPTHFCHFVANVLAHEN